MSHTVDEQRDTVVFDFVLKFETEPSLECELLLQSDVVARFFKIILR